MKEEANNYYGDKETKVPNEQFAQGFDESVDPEDVKYGDYEDN